MRSRATVMFLAVLAAVSVAACSSGGGSPSAGGSTSSGDATSSAGTVAAHSTNVTFKVNGTTTYGTLDIPAHRSGQRLAAALLIPGSGPTDRNGNDAKADVTADTLGIVAGLLARQGIMSFRYDKYFAGKTGAGAFASNPGSITMQDFLTMADDAYNFMRAQPQADPGKLLVVGHSEGGMIALSVAGTVSDKPAGLALLEPQDEHILDLVRIQADETINGAVAQGQLTDTQARANGRLLDTAISEFRAGQQPSTKGMAPFLVQFLAPEILTQSNDRFERTDDAIYPPTLAAKVKSGTQVLITDGTKDPNVPPATIGPLVQALKNAGTTGPGLKLLQGTDHFMHLPNQPNTQPVLAPAAVAAIQQWAQPFASAP